MGIDRANIPEEYSCEQCMPRKVSKARARMIQKQKREEIFKSSSEDENSNTKSHPDASNNHSPSNELDQPNRRPLKTRNKKTSLHSAFPNGGAGRKKSHNSEFMASAQRSIKVGAYVFCLSIAG